MREYKTQKEAAGKGILTPEMKIVAEKEHMEPEKLMALVARRGCDSMQCPPYFYFS